MKFIADTRGVNAQFQIGYMMSWVSETAVSVTTEPGDSTLAQQYIGDTTLSQQYVGNTALAQSGVGKVGLSKVIS